MAHQDPALREALEMVAWAVAMAGGALLGLALVAELLRRTRTGTGLVALADRLLPTTARRVATALLTTMAAATAVAVPHPARGDDHVRSWLVEETPAPSPSSPTVTSSLPTTTSTSAPPVLGSSTTPAPARAPVVAPRPRAVLRPPASVPAPHASTVPAPPANAAPLPDAGVASYTVRPGDCLWSIAATRLGRSATTRAIDRGWRVIYDANRHSVGPDPNLIHPGLVLTLPPLDPNP
jgi:resuscitation-promoting factor RpfA